MYIGELQGTWTLSCYSKLRFSPVIGPPLGRGCSSSFRSISSTFCPVSNLAPSPILCRLEQKVTVTTRVEYERKCMYLPLRATRATVRACPPTDAASGSRVAWPSHNNPRRRTSHSTTARPTSLPLFLATPRLDCLYRDTYTRTHPPTHRRGLDVHVQSLISPLPFPSPLALPAPCPSSSAAPNLSRRPQAKTPIPTPTRCPRRLARSGRRMDRPRVFPRSAESSMAMATATTTASLARRA